MHLTILPAPCYGCMTRCVVSASSLGYLTTRTPNLHTLTYRDLKDVLSTCKHTFWLHFQSQQILDIFWQRHTWHECKPRKPPGSASRTIIVESLGHSVVISSAGAGRGLAVGARSWPGVVKMMPWFTRQQTAIITDTNTRTWPAPRSPHSSRVLLISTAACYYVYSLFLARYFPSPYFCCLFPSASIYISLSPRHGPSSPLNTLFTIIGVEGPIGLNISHYSPHRRICVTLDTRRHAGGGCWISRTNVGTITLITACCRQPSAQSWTAHSANTALSVLG